MLRFRRIASAILVGAGLTLTACRTDEAAAPSAITAADDVASNSTLSKHWPRRTGRGLALSTPGSSQAPLAHCSNRQLQFGAAVIGPSGGTLVVGNNRLIVPPGALAAPTLITAVVPPNDIASIHFEPEGLQFRKPAGLQLNAEGCELPSDHPSILYLDDHGNVLEQIDAIYSNWWHTVAAPITHFSVYAIGV